MSSVADVIARRAAAHLRDGEVVNLGIGIPTRITNFLPASVELTFETENGMLGVGPPPAPGDEDPNLIDAGKLPITELPGASYFSSAESFALIRGGHVDAVVLGALQVDERGRIANWSLPGRPILGVGGAMDLIAGARRIVVTTTHTTKEGVAKIVPECTLPLSGERQAEVVVTEHATFENDGTGLVLTDVAEGSSLEWIRAHTTAAFRVASAAERVTP